MANTKITNPELFNLGDSTSATQLPVMTTTQRTDITGLSVGEMIFNSTTDKVEYFDGTKWYGITYEVAGESPYNNVLYTGSGNTTSGQSITGVGFKPDLVWFKSTGTTYNNVLYDSIRGTNAAISSNLTNSTYSNYNRLQSFDNDGFTIKANNTADLWKIDRSGQPFVAWCFKAGGAAVSNTDGTVASQVSANIAGGFSIVSYTGNGSAGATVGHGIDTPELIIVKRLSGVENWAVYSDYSHPTVPQNYLLTLDNNSAAGLNSTRWNNTAPTNAVFSIGTSQAVNANTNTYIAYCFHSVPGFSKIGSYTGTGAGTTVTTGFQPAFVMIKKTSGSADWIIFNDKTGSNILKPNTSASEVSLTNYITYNSTGFTFPTSDSNINTGDFIFMSFA